MFGTPLEDLGPEFRDFFANVNTDLAGFEGAMQNAVDAQEQTFGQRFTAIMRTVQSALEPLGTVMLDLAERVLPIVSVAIATVSEWFGNLSPTIQLLIVAIGAIIALIGPLAIILVV